MKRKGWGGGVNRIAKQEVKLWYRHHKLRQGDRDPGRHVTCQSCLQYEQNGWAFIRPFWSVAGWEVPWEGLDLRQGGLLYSRGRPWRSWQLTPFWLPSSPQLGCKSSLKEDLGCTNLLLFIYVTLSSILKSLSSLICSTSTFCYYFQLYQSALLSQKPKHLE